MMKSANGTIAALALAILFTGCAQQESGKMSVRNDNNLNSTLWMQRSAEFEANTVQTYNMAEYNLEKVIKAGGKSAAIEQQSYHSSLPPAIIMDIDETVLNNSGYDAQLILDGETYSYPTWDKWISLSQATAVPGAVDFINYAKKSGVEVFFITNRKCQERAGNTDKCPQKSDTIDNLESVGIPGITSSTVLLRKEQEGWLGEKSSRRQFVAERYRIVMLFGDDLGDFLPDVKKNITLSQRAQLIAKNKEKWGSVWYMLPNPKYGSWLHLLKEPKTQYLEGYEAK